MADKKNDFTIKYVIPEEMHDRYTNGVWGGFTKEGMVNMHFYHERLPLPKKTCHTTLEDGTIDPTGEAVFGGDVVRIVQSSVIMDIETALQIRDWLNERLEKIEGNEKNDD